MQYEGCLRGGLVLLLQLRDEVHVEGVVQGALKAVRGQVACLMRARAGAGAGARAGAGAGARVMARVRIRVGVREEISMREDKHTHARCLADCRDAHP